MNTHRFTVDGSDALEAQVRDCCTEIGKRVEAIVPASDLEALILAGGYGRGEGGVKTAPDGTHLPYNDLEFFLFIEGMPRLNERRYHAEIHKLEQEMTADIGIDVEFKILSLDALRSSPTNMFFYDLACGYYHVVGRDNWLDGCDHHLDASKIPLHEAIRLLMNRCSGMLFASRTLKQGMKDEADHEFVVRNIAKTQLAMGDALLAAKGRYHWSCVERHERLKQLEGLDLPLEDLVAAHATAVEFKLRPSHRESSPEALQALHEQTRELAWQVWRTIESQRLNRKITSPLDYADGSNKCPETNPIRNALIRLRSFGPMGCLPPRTFRYPREAMLNTLPLMLFAPEEAEHNLPLLATQLRQPVGRIEDAWAAYETLWNRFN